MRPVSTKTRHPSGVDKLVPGSTGDAAFAVEGMAADWNPNLLTAPELRATSAIHVYIYM